MTGALDLMVTSQLPLFCWNLELGIVEKGSKQILEFPHCSQPTDGLAEARTMNVRVEACLSLRRLSSVLPLRVFFESKITNQMSEVSASRISHDPLSMSLVKRVKYEQKIVVRYASCHNESGKPLRPFTRSWTSTGLYTYICQQGH